MCSFFHPQTRHLYSIVGITEDPNLSKDEQILENVKERLTKLAEKWKRDFFATREPNFENLETVLAKDTHVTTEYDDLGKLVGKIFCIVCLKPVRMGYLKHKRRNGETYHFTNTNYFHHLRTHSTEPNVRMKKSEQVLVKKEQG